MSLSEQLFTQENTPEYSYMQEEASAKRITHSTLNSSSVSTQDNDYISTLKNALSQALDENDMLRNRIMELEALVSSISDEVDQKDKAILELAGLLQAKTSKA